MVLKRRKQARPLKTSSRMKVIFFFFFFRVCCVLLLVFVCLSIQCYVQVLLNCVFFFFQSCCALLFVVVSLKHLCAHIRSCSLCVCVTEFCFFFPSFVLDFHSLYPFFSPLFFYVIIISSFFFLLRSSLMNLVVEVSHLWLRLCFLFFLL